MSSQNWNGQHIKDQKGKVIVITGATSGIGKQTAKIMAHNRASVIIAVRNMSKGAQVVEEIKSEAAHADICTRELDLSSLESVKKFSEKLKADYEHLDILINNAGVMMCPEAKTQDGFELQFGTNHLGHFALTGRLLPLLKIKSGARIVIVSSIAHRYGKLNLEDLNWEKRNYNTRQVYYDSKLANLYFAYGLAEKLQQEGSQIMVTAAHPGWTITNLQKYSAMLRFLSKFMAQGPKMGALPTLRAAFDPGARTKDYFGPAKFLETRGRPIKVKSSQLSHNRKIAQELWRKSEEMTQVVY